MSECPLKIEAYFYNPMEGDWEEVMNRDGHNGGMISDIANLNYDASPADPYVSFSLTQLEYIEQFVETFGYGEMYSPSLYISAKFVIYDRTDPTTAREDFFAIEVVQSGQNAASFCDYS
jgi:hypothetical protein